MQQQMIDYWLNYEKKLQKELLAQRFFEQVAAVILPISLPFLLLLLHQILLLYNQKVIQEEGGKRSKEEGKKMVRRTATPSSIIACGCELRIPTSA